MQELPSNPYRDLPLRQMYGAMQNRAGQLLDGKPVGRRDTAYLLLAAAFYLAPMTTQPGSPGNVVRAGGSPLDAYLPEYESAARALRHHVAGHAWDAVAARGTAPALPREAALAQAATNEAGLRAVLTQLGGL
ncbi:hypothetical protein ACFONC_11570 [Luteimonas soli]|uniref:Uncharacterized protein n=1 Tax=Luteimonas soli TaxID=1648966 RepID=A0ABV7XPL6_9GAMM